MYDDDAQTEPVCVQGATRQLLKPKLVSRASAATYQPGRACACYRWQHPRSPTTGLASDAVQLVFSFKVLVFHSTRWIQSISGRKLLASHILRRNQQNGHCNLHHHLVITLTRGWVAVVLAAFFTLVHSTLERFQQCQETPLCMLLFIFPQMCTVQCMAD